jgi:hypothetical protein
MNESKSTVLPAGHIVEIRYGKFSFRYYNPKSVAFSVVIRPSTKADKKDLA